MTDDIYNDILFRLRVPLPYELRGLTVQDLITERKDAADEIERLRALCDQLAEALRIQCEFHRMPVATEAWYSQHARDAFAKYEANHG